MSKYAETTEVFSKEGSITEDLFFHLTKRFGPLGVFLGFTLEGFGLPVPMELLYSIVGNMINQGRIHYWQGTLIAFAGTLVGNSIGYYIGFRGGRALTGYLAKVFNIPDESLCKFEGWFKKHGLKALFAIRWTGLGYAQLTWFCGLERVPFLRFLAVAAIADLLWAAFWTYSGHRLTGLFHTVFQPKVLLTISILVFVVGGYVIVGRIRKIRAQECDKQPN